MLWLCVLMDRVLKNAYPWALQLASSRMPPKTLPGRYSQIVPLCEFDRFLPVRTKLLRGYIHLETWPETMAEPYGWNGRALWLETMAEPYGWRLWMNLISSGDVL